MPSRTRSYDDRLTSIGSSYWNTTGSTSYASSSNGEIATCKDFVGNTQGVNPFSLVKQYFQRGIFSGEIRSPSGVLLRKVSAYPSGPYAAPNPSSVFGALNIADQRSLMISAIASSSPSQANVSLPISLGELKDLPSLVKPFAQMYSAYKGLQNLPFHRQVAGLPSLLRGFGNTLLGWSANNYISWRWAVKPMMSDIRKLLNFAELVDDRSRFLGKLRRGEAVRRKVKLRHRHQEVDETNITLASAFGTTISAKRKVIYDESVWASLRWKSSPNSFTTPYLTPIADRRKAFNMTFGINSFELLRTAWELMPWSWLVDWFGGIGDIISLHNQTVPAFHSDLCVMRHMRAKRVYTIIPGTWSQWINVDRYPTETYDSKERVLDAALWFPALPSVNFPLLDSGKWSILSALACASVDRGLPGIWRRRVQKRVG